MRDSRPGADGGGECRTRRATKGPGGARCLKGVQRAQWVNRSTLPASPQYGARDSLAAGTPTNGGPPGRRRATPAVAVGLWGWVGME